MLQTRYIQDSYSFERTWFKAHLRLFQDLSSIKTLGNHREKDICQIFYTITVDIITICYDVISIFASPEWGAPCSSIHYNSGTLTISPLTHILSTSYRWMFRMSNTAYWNLSYPWKSFLLFNQVISSEQIENSTYHSGKWQFSEEKLCALLISPDLLECSSAWSKPLLLPRWFCRKLYKTIIYASHKTGINLIGFSSR